MHKSSHHNMSSANIAAAAAAAASNLPFSIEHILSSNSALPMKQQVAAFDRHTASQQINHNQHHLHLNAQDHLNQRALHQRQQPAQNAATAAAAMFMLNQAATQQPTAGSVSGGLGAGGAGHQRAVDLVSSTAMLNEQIALLAAQQQLQQQWQQQQLMAAAAAMTHQHQQQQPQQAGLHAALGPLNALSSLNTLAGQSLPGLNEPSSLATTNHLLSHLASMLIQQHQQQQHQKQPYRHPLEPHNQRHLLQQHIGGAGPPHANSLAANFLSPLEQQQQQNFQQQKRSPHSPATHIQQQAQPQTQQQQHRSDSSSINRRRDSQADNHHKTGTPTRRPLPSIAGGIGGRQAAKDICASKSKFLDTIDVGDSCGGTALSSLSNFVLSTAAGFGSDADDCQPEQGGNGDKLGQLEGKLGSSNGKRNSSSQSQGSHLRLSGQPLKSGNSFAESSSGNESSHEDEKSCQAANRSQNNNYNNSNNSVTKSPSILEAVSCALKGIPPAASAISTTLAKAPPELVQKQPAWVFCTRYSDRPSSGPRTRRAKSKDKKPKDAKLSADEKRPRTAFTSEQLEKLRQEFQSSSYLDEKRRKSLAESLCLNENQIKIWFQNKRAKMKKQSNQPNALRTMLVAGGLYNHSTATSDCSESYANGLADDIGNRAMRDFEPDDEAASGSSSNNNNNGTICVSHPAGDEDDCDGMSDGDECAPPGRGGQPTASAIEIDRLKQVSALRNIGSLADHRSSESGRLAGADQDNNNNVGGVASRDGNGHSTRLLVTGDRQAASNKRRTSQSDGDDEDEDNAGANSPQLSSNASKRFRGAMNNMDRNSQSQLLAVGLAMACGSESPVQEFARDGGGALTSKTAPSDEDDCEPVISVS